MVFSLGARYVPFPIMRRSMPVGGLHPAGGGGVSSQMEQYRVLDAGRHERGVALGLYRGAERRVPVDGFRGRVASSVQCPMAPPAADQTRILGATLLNRAITVYGFSPQIAFSNQVRESNAQLLRLQTQPRGNALGAAVLGFSSVISDNTPTWSFRA